MTNRVTLYTRPGCHLCEVAVQVIEAVCAETGDDYSEVDISEDPFLADQYGERIPVVLVDGTEIAQFRVDSARLRQLLLSR